jgi:hypothetical protein
LEYRLFLQSHHKKPIKAALPQSHLFVSDGTLSHDNTILVQGEDDEPAVRPPARQMLYHPFTPQVRNLSFFFITTS